MVRVLGTACGLGVEGSGWVAAPGLVVTNAHVVAGERTPRYAAGPGSALDATPVHYDPTNDLALLRVGGLDGTPLSLVAGRCAAAPRGRSSAIRRTARSRSRPARLGATGPVITQDSYGRGPITRELTALRGEIRSGNSGGPLVDGAGKVLGTVFAATTQGKPGGYGVPNDIVARGARRLERRGEHGALHGLDQPSKPAWPVPYDR